MGFETGVSRKPMRLPGSSPDRPPQGLVASLAELSLTSSLLAVAMPVIVLAVHLIMGYSLDSAPSSTELPGPLVAITFASFVLVPMLAFIGVATSLTVTGATVFSHERGGRQLSKALFLICVATWGLITAYVYDIVVIPVITR